MTDESHFYGDGLDHGEPSADRAKLDALRDLWMQPVPPDAFYVNGFPTRLDQLADLYDEDIAARMRAILSPEPTLADVIEAHDGEDEDG